MRPNDGAFWRSGNVLENARSGVLLPLQGERRTQNTCAFSNRKPSPLRKPERSVVDGRGGPTDPHVPSRTARGIERELSELRSDMSYADTRQRSPSFQTSGWRGRSAAYRPVRHDGRRHHASDQTSTHSRSRDRR